MLKLSRRLFYIDAYRAQHDSRSHKIS